MRRPVSQRIQDTNVPQQFLNHLECTFKTSSTDCCPGAPRRIAEGSSHSVGLHNLRPTCFLGLTLLRSWCGGGCQAMQCARDSASACASISFSAAFPATLYTATIPLLSKSHSQPRDASTPPVCFAPIAKHTVQRSCVGGQSHFPCRCHALCCACMVGVFQLERKFTRIVEKAQPSRPLAVA